MFFFFADHWGWVLAGLSDKLGERVCISLPAPLIGGILWEQIGPWAPLLVPVIAILLMVPVVWVKFVLPKEDAADAASGLAAEVSKG